MYNWHNSAVWEQLSTEVKILHNGKKSQGSFSFWTILSMDLEKFISCVLLNNDFQSSFKQTYTL